ncbi:RNA polymerase sigma-70 factor [Polaribacter batillariae]|uniref:RNA polymerase sigma-70 factor n=1 Tax=Polaribacter batillariae TaxID=2808900 RepID=A0ABX7T0K9_9FLAO|nr:RNA polymerase sigma-70 factor [Polaribacter batillariae]QTD38623.1 RNA polymerase sigma-70 factor [Polaribacter batillariae]
MDNNLIIKQLKNKDKKVFRNCYELYFEDLVLYANKYVYDFSISEDIVQEVFVQLWMQANTINIKVSFKSYIYKMVKNRSLNYLKSVKIVDTENYIELSNLIVSDLDVSDFSEEEREAKYQKIMQVVQTMPKKMQKIFKLKFIENYKYKEIADELNISINTVKTQLKRAKVKFDKSLILFLLFLFLNN